MLSFGVHNAPHTGDHLGKLNKGKLCANCSLLGTNLNSVYFTRQNKQFRSTDTKCVDTRPLQGFYSRNVLQLAG
jgi:hypothetical protein